MQVYVQSDKRSHLFVSSCDGALHDTRNPNWSSNLLRENFSRTHREIKNLADLKATLRAGPVAWPGGYPLYFITADGGALSFKTVRQEWRAISGAHLNNDRRSGWFVVACEINYEDRTLIDDHTGERIESAYGDDEDEGVEPGATLDHFG